MKADQLTRSEREQIINDCPEHLYTNNPTGSQRVYHFKQGVSFKGQQAAYEYAFYCQKAMDQARAMAKATGSVGASCTYEGPGGVILGRATYERPEIQP